MNSLAADEPHGSRQLLSITGMQRAHPGARENDGGVDAAAVHHLQHLEVVLKRVARLVAAGAGIAAEEQVGRAMDRVGVCQ